MSCLVLCAASSYTDNKPGQPSTTRRDQTSSKDNMAGVTYPIHATIVSIEILTFHYSCTRSILPLMRLLRLHSCPRHLPPQASYRPHRQFWLLPLLRPGQVQDLLVSSTLWPDPLLLPRASWYPSLAVPKSRLPQPMAVSGLLRRQPQERLRASCRRWLEA